MKLELKGWSVKWYKMGTYHLASTHKTIVTYQGAEAGDKAQAFMDTLNARTNHAETSDRYYLVADHRKVTKG